MDTRQAFLGSMVMARYWAEACHLFDYQTFCEDELNQPIRQLERKSDLLPALQVMRLKGWMKEALSLLSDVKRRGWRIDGQMMGMAIQTCKKERLWTDALVLWERSSQAPLGLPPLFEITKGCRINPCFDMFQDTTYFCLVV